MDQREVCRAGCGPRFGPARRAAAAGLVSGWANRRGEPWPRVFTAPRVTGADLPAVVTTLLDLD